MRSMSWHGGDSKGMRSSDPETETATSASDSMGSPTLLASTSIETHETQLEQAEVEQVEQVYISSQLAADASAIPSTVDPMQGDKLVELRGIVCMTKACKPCVFAASRTGCANTSCEFCHDHHSSSSGRRPRKETRERCKEAVESVPRKYC